jgi:hypothetical protein
MNGVLLDLPQSKFFIFTIDNDLEELENAWNEHRDIILKEYDNDRKGIIEPKAGKKKAKK